MMSKEAGWFGWAGALVLTSSLVGCAGADGAVGPAGADGKDGKDGAQGATGAAGAQGATGATGANGASAQTATAAIALVTPDRLTAGRTTKVVIIGTGVKFTAATTLDFGAGVTPANQRLLSEVSIEAQVTVAADAVLGARALSATTGSATVTQANAITIDGALAVNALSGAFATGAEGTVRVRTTAPRVFAPTVAGSSVNVGNATIAASGAITLGTDLKWLSSDLAEITYSVNPFFDTATKATFTVTYGEGGTDAWATSFAASPTTALTAGAPATGSIPASGFSIMTYSAAANVGVTFSLAATSGATLAPRIRAFAGGATPAFLSAVSGSSITVRTTAAGPLAFVVSDATTPAASSAIGFTANLVTVPSESEPNNDRATANAITAGATGVLASFPSSTDNDYFTFTTTQPEIVQVRTRPATTAANADTQIWLCGDADASCSYGESRTNNRGSDDDSGSFAGWVGSFASGSSIITARLAAAGKYHAAARLYSAASASDYGLSVTYKTATDENASNDTVATATTLPFGNVGRGSITTADTSADWWKVTLPTAGGFMFMTTAPDLTDTANGNLSTQIWVCTEAAALASTCTYAGGNLGANSTSGPFNYSLLKLGKGSTSSATDLAAGSYYVGVQRSGTVSTGDYLLVVEQL